MIIKELTKASHMRQQDYINYMFQTFGIRIEDHGKYKGYIKTSDSYYIIYFPLLDDGKIISFRPEHCNKTAVCTIGDVKRYISHRARNEVDQEYFKALINEMKEITAK